MSLLLDTHALLWWLAGEPMEEQASGRIADRGTLVAVSAASIWEIAIKRALGRLRFDGSIAQEARAAGFEPLAVSFDHAEHAGSLPAHHRDPFDRMLVAQAQDEGLTIVTRDPRARCLRGRPAPLLIAPADRPAAARFVESALAAGAGSLAPLLIHQS